MSVCLFIIPLKLRYQFFYVISLPRRLSLFHLISLPHFMFFLLCSSIISSKHGNIVKEIDIMLTRGQSTIAWTTSPPQLRKGGAPLG